ncbi:hypothetical protein ABZ260_04075 [Streptosporangium sp. NPDC006013]|uniref:hypothetical protein n=1 Tax=Streptosporangium sp. NPDC006013 TaxID=3155596 RepID=UPI00339DAAAA
MGIDAAVDVQNQDGHAVAASIGQQQPPGVRTFSEQGNSGKNAAGKDQRSPGVAFTAAPVMRPVPSAAKPQQIDERITGSAEHRVCGAAD